MANFVEVLLERNPISNERLQAVPNLIEELSSSFQDKDESEDNSCHDKSPSIINQNENKVIKKLKISLKCTKNREARIRRKKLN